MSEQSGFLQSLLGGAYEDAPEGGLDEAATPAPPPTTPPPGAAHAAATPPAPGRIRRRQRETAAPRMARPVEEPPPTGHVGFLAGLLGFVESAPTTTAFEESPVEQPAPATEPVETSGPTPATTDTIAEPAPAAPAAGPGEAVATAPSHAAASDVPTTSDAVAMGFPAPEIGFQAAGEPVPAIDTTPAVAASPTTASPPTAGQDVAAPRPDGDLLVELTSFDPNRRRRALRTLLLEELEPGQAAAVAIALQDPEAELRGLALQVFERNPDLVPLDALRAATYDVDATTRVRALALAGRTADPRMLAELGERLLTESDEQALSVGLTALTSLVASLELDADDIDRVCTSIGRLGIAHLQHLTTPLHTLSATLPAEEVLHRLGSNVGSLRAGAAVLAFSSNDEQALRTVARLVADEHPTVRRYARAAIAERGDTSAPTGAPPLPQGGPEPLLPELPVGSRPATRAVVDEVEQALLPGLLEALSDPKPEIREQVGDAIARLPHERVVAYLGNEATTADAARLERIIVAADLVGSEAVADDLARAALRLAAQDMPPSLLRALREFAPLRRVVATWQRADAPEQRIHALQLRAWLEPLSADTLLAALSDPNAGVRVTAVELAAQAQMDDDIAAALAEAVTHDSSSRVRLASLAALRGSTAAERVAAARRALASPYAETRRACLELLTGDSEDEFALLAAALRDEDVEVAHRAGAIITAGRRPEAIALLWSQLRGSGGVVRQRLLEVLRQLDDAAFRRLAAQAASGGDPTERVVGISALAALGDERARAALVHALGDPASDVRLEALQALSGHAGAMALGPILTTLRDPDPTVRARAVGVLADLDDDGAIPHLVRALDDPSDLVRTAAGDALLQRRSPRVVSMLMDRLDGPSQRGVVAALLARMGTFATDAMLQRLPTADDGLRRAIVEGLRESGMGQRLLEQLRAADPATRRAALESLAVLRDPATIDAIGERLTDPDAQVRMLAATILGDLGDARAIDRLRTAFSNDPDMDVVAAVERAYRQLTTDA